MSLMFGNWIARYLRAMWSRSHAFDRTQMGTDKKAIKDGNLYEKVAQRKSDRLICGRLPCQDQPFSPADITAKSSLTARLYLHHCAGRCRSGQYGIYRFPLKTG